jgi:hypothetical protein
VHRRTRAGIARSLIGYPRGCVVLSAAKTAADYKPTNVHRKLLCSSGDQKASSGGRANSLSRCNVPRPKIAGMATITPRHLRHAVTNREDCDCYKSEYRDPKCEKGWPDIGPWWAYQMHRRISGDFSSPEWWAYQLRQREDFSDQPPDPREFDSLAPGTDPYWRSGAS